MVKVDLEETTMCVDTPIENHVKTYGLYVKREDLCCPSGPHFSKTRGVFQRVKSRPEKVIGVLDTFHSQAGHAVAQACKLLGKTCWNYFPVYAKEKDEDGAFELRRPQIESQNLGAILKPLAAGRSCILYHRAKKDVEENKGYMMPNALKLEESVIETAIQAIACTKVFEHVIIPSSSATIASGVIRGLEYVGLGKPTYWIHLGYDRSEEAVRRYLQSNFMESLTFPKQERIKVIQEGYAYKDKAKAGESPSWNCNPYYDLKAFRWWLRERERNKKLALAGELGKVLFWNIG